MLYAIIFVSILFRHASPHQDIQNLWCKPAAVGDGQGACGAICARSGSDHGFTSGMLARRWDASYFITTGLIVYGSFLKYGEAARGPDRKLRERIARLNGCLSGKTPKDERARSHSRNPSILLEIKEYFLPTRARCS